MANHVPSIEPLHPGVIEVICWQSGMFADHYLVLPCSSSDENSEDYIYQLRFIPTFLSLLPKHERGPGFRLSVCFASISMVKKSKYVYTDSVLSLPPRSCSSQLWPPFNKPSQCCAILPKKRRQYISTPFYRPLPEVALLPASP